MNFSSLCASTILLACYLSSTPIEVNGANVPATNAAIGRYMADAKHTVETAGEHRKNDLAVFLKTGRMPDVPSLPKKDGANKVAVDKMEDVPTEVLMQQFLDGGSHIKQHLNATGRGRGPDKTSSPTVASTKTPVPSKSPKVEKSKKKKGKSKSDSSTKEPKVGKKDAKKKKEGKKDHHSDYPSSSPTPTLPGKGDVSLPPNYENGNATNSSHVEHDKVSSDNGSNGDGHQDDGRSTDGTADSDVDRPVDTSSPSNTSSIAKIVSPLAAFAGLVLLAGVWISRRRNADSELDQEENLMKHTREGFDVETATVSGNTYRTGAFTEDDGTLEESVDVHEENRKNKMSQIHAKEMIHVMHELEEVSINDDSASTTSVSSGTHSPTNSCDGSLIEAARAAMSAEIFQHNKSKVYDSSVKPEWATRTNATASDVQLNEDCFESLDTTSLRATSYKKFIAKSPSPTAEYIEENEVSEVKDVDGEASLMNTCEVKVGEDVPSDDNTSTPVWMKTQLRPVSVNSSTPRSELFNDQTSSVEAEPEWMKKFKQMGLEKKE